MNKTLFKLICSFSFCFSTNLRADELKVWAHHLRMGQLPVRVLEQGGQGDCFFFSVAAAIQTIEPRASCKGLRARVAKYINQDNWENFLMGFQDGFILTANPIKTEDVHWLLVFKDQENFPGKPWKLLKEIIKKEASKGPYEIQRGGGLHNLYVNYWGNSQAMKILSQDPFFRKIRLIVLNSRQVSIGYPVTEEHNGKLREVSSAKLFSDDELRLYETSKEFNILLWWTGGHFQILGKQVDSKFVGRDSETGAYEPGIKKQDGVLYRVLWQNAILPSRVRELYEKQCHWVISD